MQTGPVDVHDVLLIAPGVRLLPLKNQLPARPGKIRLGILATKGELANVAQMILAGIGSDILRLQEREDREAEHRTRKLEVNGVTGNLSGGWC
jgi:hypothetical protein